MSREVLTGERMEGWKDRYTLRNVKGLSRKTKSCGMDEVDGRYGPFRDKKKIFVLTS